MIQTRKPNTEEEKETLSKCYKEGLENDWANGNFERLDGNFISPDDCLNKDSISFIDKKGDLKAFFKQGNWCLGQGIIYKNMFFLQQVNGGDEWASYRIDDDLTCWDSISWGRIIEDNEFDKYFKEFSKPKTKKEYYGG